MADLRSARAKLKRAREHAETLNAELRGNVTGVPWAYHYPVTNEVQPDGLEYRFYVDPPPFDGTRAALIAGDCLFDLRAALDHIVYALTDRRFRGRIPQSVIRGVQFPLRPAERRDRGGVPQPTEKWQAIGHLSSRQRSAIKALQPYNRRNDHLQRTREFLGELAMLNNIDKHRYLHVVRVQTVGMRVPTWNLLDGDPYGFRQKTFVVPLEGKTEVCRWTFTSIPPDIAQEVQMQDEVLAGVALDERGEQLMLLPHVEAWINAVETVIDRFEIFFR